ncbi:hypothetical protein ACTFIV_005979 [Dictyostelium citrinum]
MLIFIESRESHSSSIMRECAIETKSLWGGVTQHQLCSNFLKLHWILMGINFWSIFFAVEHFLRKVETYSPPGTLQGASSTQKTSTREVPTLRAQLARRVGTGIH